MISRLEKKLTENHTYANAVDVKICIEKVAYFYKIFLQHIKAKPMLLQC